MRPAKLTGSGRGICALAHYRYQLAQAMSGRGGQGRCAHCGDRGGQSIIGRGTGVGKAIDTKFDTQLVSTGSKVSPFWTAIDPTPARLPASRPVHQGSLTWSSLPCVLTDRAKPCAYTLKPHATGPLLAHRSNASLVRQNETPRQLFGQTERRHCKIHCKRSRHSMTRTVSVK